MTDIQILNLLFGVALLLFGMHLMSDHLKKVGGSQSELLLYRLTNSPLKAIAVGTGVTAFIQSSSAVSAMVVGLVENNLISLKRGIAIILGSILGTAATGWIIAYSSLRFASPLASLLSARVLSAVFAIIGIIFKVFIKKTKFKRIGEIFLGFAILMLGISTISAAVEPLKNNTAFLNALISLQNPILLLGIGVIAAAILQSASAAVGIVQTVSITGLIGLPAAYFIILGIGIGASLPVLLTAIGKNTAAKRSAFSYLCVNTIGAAVFGIIGGLIHLSTKINIIMTPVTISLMNTIYRLCLVLLLIGLIPQIERLCIFIIKDKRGEKDLKRLKVFNRKNEIKS